MHGKHTDVQSQPSRTPNHRQEMQYSLGLILKCSVMRDRTKHCDELEVPFRETHLEVLDEVVEHTETLRVLAVVDVGERSNLGGLRCQLWVAMCDSLQRRRRASLVTHLERDVVLVYPDLELLTTDDVLLRPLRVVFPVPVSLSAAPEAHLVISLSRTIRLNSSATAGPTYTGVSGAKRSERRGA